MKVSTCEKCAKAFECSIKKPTTFTGVCPSFLSYGKAAKLSTKRTLSSGVLTYKPFANILKNEV